MAGASLAGLLLRAEQAVDALPVLHREALALLGGPCAVLFERSSRSGHLTVPTSSVGLDRLRSDPWAPGRAEAKLTERIFAAGRPRLLPDLAASAPALAAYVGTPAAVLVPLKRREERLGLLVVGLREPRRLSDLQAPLAGLADAFTLTIEYLRQRRDLALQRDLRGLLQDFTQEVSSTSKLASGLQLFCERANRLFAAGRTSIWLHERRARHLVLQAASDRALVARGGRVSTDDPRSPVAAAMRHSRAEAVSGRRPVLTVPLKGYRRALGAIIFDGVRFDSGSERDLLERADEVAHQLSRAIENMQLLEEVLRSRRELENTFDSIADLVAVCDRRQRLVRANKAFATRVGLAWDDIADRPLADFIGPDTQRWFNALDQARPRPGGRGPVTREITDPVLQGTFSVTVTDLLRQDHEPVGRVIVARDITPQARLEAERAELRTRLTQSEKLAALGQFVAGIAHELNNPLQGVLGHLELLRATGAFPKQLRRDVQVIYREADRAAKIVRNLLVFAGSRRAARRTMRLNVVIQRVLAARAAGCRAASIEVVRHYDEHLPKLSGDPLPLHQAFLNIILNAEQALAPGGGGRIDVQTTLNPSGQLLVARFRDNGPGIPQDVLPRIFEPFYTT
ncbi:MAG TPA: histidine kinase dimerization/phospho-acceptor domain-containing protein, partial [Vicinamibacterales bacterium]|nr:histidine kinase dimerization/phospho-acceptor domain-containing protein [Vicinamibacterales bacterium]